MAFYAVGDGTKLPSTGAPSYGFPIGAFRALKILEGRDGSKGNTIQNPKIGKSIR